MALLSVSLVAVWVLVSAAALCTVFTVVAVWRPWRGGALLRSLVLAVVLTWLMARGVFRLWQVAGVLVLCSETRLLIVTRVWCVLLARL